MSCDSSESEYVFCDDGLAYEVLGKTDTRTATHLVYGRTAIPLFHPKGSD